MRAGRTTCSPASEEGAWVGREGTNVSYLAATRVGDPPWWEMDWAKPHYSRTKADEAGERLLDQQGDLAGFADALLVADNWRTSHAYPLNTFQITLRNRARTIYPHALVAQRVKRFTSILTKLRNRPKMRLSRMQDSGGCGAVMPTVADAERLRNWYVEDGYSTAVSHGLKIPS